MRGVVAVGDTKKEFELKAVKKKPQTLELKVKVKAGTSRVVVSFLNPYSDPNIEDKAKKERIACRSQNR